jgi:hypothetical protein
MECNKWEESGLLFVSKELTETESEAFALHVKTCESCKIELMDYEHEKKSFFNEYNLGENTSEEIDRRIIAACSKPSVIPTGIGMFSGFIVKKTLIAAFFLVFGIGAGIYFSFNYPGTTGSGIAVMPKSSNDQVVAEKNEPVVSKSADSMKLAKKDSVKNNEVPSINLPQIPQQQGIITVDLKKE